MFLINVYVQLPFNNLQDFNMKRYKRTPIIKPRYDVMIYLTPSHGDPYPMNPYGVS